MLKLRKIAITGGIASGKSTVCRILKEHGAYLLSSDKTIHKLLTEDLSSIQQVTNLLGPSILDNGTINRSKVARAVFSDAQKLAALEQILHPKLLQTIDKEYVHAQKKHYTFFVVEIPLVQEIQATDTFDVIVAIVCDENIAKQRSPLPEEEYVKRMKRQWPIEKKARYADYVVMNNSSLQELETHVLALIEDINKRGE